MKKSIKLIPFVLASVMGLSLFGLAPATFADDPCTYLDASSPAYEANGCSGKNTAALPDIIVGILNGIVVTLGLVATIYIIIGGINYMTSAGDTAKLEKAKKTILYACIGLIICALAFAIINFTISIIRKA